MGKSNGSFLLSDGDILCLASRTLLQYSAKYSIEETCFDMLQAVEMRVFEKEYKVTQRKLGSGAYGKVYMAYKKATGQQFACKIIDLRVVREKVITQMEQEESELESTVPREQKALLKRRIQEKLAVYDREAGILSSLSHYKGGKLSDIEAAVIVRQALMALDYLHDRNIVHRDIKPDNILMTSLTEGCRIVLSDFGCAIHVNPGAGRMSTLVGTFDYTAPEVLRLTRKGYTKAIDLWSMGCVAVVLLTGDTPFMDSLQPNSTEVNRQKDVERLEIDMEWNEVGRRARDFIRNLLSFDEECRMDVKQALSHSWFTNSAHRDEFDALYRRSVQDWKPRFRNKPLMVELRDLIDSC
ncbi:hypothetical protein FE257_009033 [Aspergillus nanangensis]|uniref:Protein kinase domain-containing protein n=1 Tax=Aspergillus nanangensis TaxID=2582783 RepID=A0AAD4CWL3_ASPNN|nr:hypothetical protein FE257_009033 [Aspergillus nanangensis]